MTAATADPPTGGRRFALPSAYTILFLLIVIVAFLTWIIPAGAYDVDAERRADPGLLSHRPGESAADRRRLVDGADQRDVRHRGRGRQHQRLELGRPVRRDRRGPVHPRHRRVPRRDDGDRRDPGRDLGHRQSAARTRELDDPDPDGRLRPRRDDVRDGRGEPGVLRADHHRHDRGRLRRPGRGGDPPARVRHRRPRLDDQPVRDRHRLGLRRRVDRGGHRRPADHPRHRDGDRDRVRHALCGAGEGRPEPLARVPPEGRQRGPFPERDGCGRRPAPP